jgi:hypothetical protein
MNRLKLLILSLVLILGMMTSIPTTIANAEVTEDQIMEAIADGIAWLASKQNTDGSWGSGGDRPAYTAFVLIKLQDFAYEMGYESPFDSEYPYSAEVIAGWQYMFTPAVTRARSIGLQKAGANDPDTNGNGYGIYFGFVSSHVTYTTGITLMALESSNTPNRPNDGVIDYNGDGSLDTYQEIAQDAADWLAWAQGDDSVNEGGWNYYELDNSGGRSDNSISGYAVLGLAAAEGFGCIVPNWVKVALDGWIDRIQYSSSGSYWDGASRYVTYSTSMMNQLKTGNLIFEMTFVGDDPSVQRFQDALGFIARAWQNMGSNVGWGYNRNPAEYQAMFCLMKGFEYSEIELIDLDGDGTAEHDWFAEFAEVLVNQQLGDGSWPRSIWDYSSPPILSTVWALLTLEKIAPPPPTITVNVDIKPGSWPNPINVKSNGVIPVAICGTEDFDVTTIDPSTILLTIEGIEDGVAPLRWTYEDVATPYTGEPGGGHELTSDGYIDLVLHFSTPEVVTTLGLAALGGEEGVPLIITGNLTEDDGGTAIQGEDYVKILDPPQKKKIAKKK